MNLALQIRDVPEEIRDLLAKQAAAKGQSMQAYLLDMVRREAQLAINVEMFERTRDIRFPIPPELDPVAIVREGRDGGFEIDRDQLVE
ncbi:hypothetical protein GCM10022234_08580 [Aeromicrobium panaciterrae]|uniref:FitA-like ribbon-helix-helix domain-containing protein n=1 Tax=Aeromicrobium panaciterrae TaxID=363861 RepID=UPI0031D6739C